MVYQINPENLKKRIGAVGNFFDYEPIVGENSLSVV